MTRWLPRLESAMIRPPEVMIRAASWARMRSARAFVAMTQSHCLGESSSPSRSTPDAALLTTTSSRPARRSTSATSRLISAGSLRSAWSRCAEPPRRSTSCAVFSAASRFTKKFTNTQAPASAKRSAIARPMPRPPPVTRTARGAASLIAPSRRDLDGRLPELAGERAEPLGALPRLGPRLRRLERVLERRDGDPARSDRRRRLEHPGLSVSAAPLAPDRQQVARTHRLPERRTREPAEPADLGEVVARGDEELGSLRERLHHERARQDRIARKMIGEHVVESDHVLQCFDAARRLHVDDAVHEQKAHRFLRSRARAARRPQAVPRGSR